MSKCLSCGKEIPEGRKFCSRSCSASYNNVRRERKPWTEEQRESTKQRKQQICKYCGKPTGLEVIQRYERGTCVDCKPFVPRLKVIRVFGYNQGPLKEGFCAAVEQIEREYEAGESTTTLSQKYGLDDLVFRGYLQEIRSRSKSRRNALELGRSKPSASPRYEQGTHKSWNGKEFHYRSSWEREFMEELDRKKIVYEYEPFTVRYWDSTRQQERVAFPDLYLPDSRTLIEIKSSWTLQGKVQEMKDKFKRYRELGYTPKLILDKVERNLEDFYE